MMNTIVLIGRLTRDPELKYTNSGTAVCNFSIAVGRDYKRDNEPDVDFFNCVAWTKTAELVAQYMSKGSLIGVQGRVQNRSWDKDGQKHYVTEIVAEKVQFLDPKEKAEPQQGSYEQGQKSRGLVKRLAQQRMVQNFDEDEDDDSLPFN